MLAGKTNNSTKIYLVLKKNLNNNYNQKTIDEL